MKELDHYGHSILEALYKPVYGKIGVTGTRHGMTEGQRSRLLSVLSTIEIAELHHGDCKGVDDEAADMAASLGIEVVCHPPSNPSLRAFNVKHKKNARPPEGYLARNRNIVDECHGMIVVPREYQRQDRGGTWYTFDYALKKGKPVFLILPDGRARVYPCRATVGPEGEA